MTKMKIGYNPTVYNHPTLCAEGVKHCSELYSENWEYYCHLFKQRDKGDPPLTRSKIYNYPEKCYTCLLWINKAKEYDNSTESETVLNRI